MYAWMISVYLLSLLVVYAMMYNNCRYRYSLNVLHYELYCQTSAVVNLPPPKAISIMEIVIQFAIPCIIFGIYIALTIKIMIMKQSSLKSSEITILKQAFFVFFVFQVSSVVFLLCQTVKFGVATAFLIKRVINTMEILAGAATPCFFFFTSKEIKKMASVKSSMNNSQASSNIRLRNVSSISALGSVA
ncbi:G_PROTEIN_RECEP_F1_2 domain-containing protein [Caenorhabditis elegans]|nr:G_PROTEIN_RECEP_F1_2 domain-containing protein [Caenorhabditis elegans]CCE71685.1 G_PROTEIN_RECEP_F1_2 domain-containing protein [Caenorhabditis elegans]|eukprot:NP_001256484.1 Uncharacterized protein CELE_F57B1.9 [Caenorhabditis elegans]